MTSQSWLTLSDFSAKYKVSLSTLRRRVRAKEVEYRFENGKYFLPDRPITKHLRAHNFEMPISKENPAGVNTEKKEGYFSHTSSEADAHIKELKQAYIAVLHEKEVQIMQLKEEIVDLKTLVKILEAENERLSSERETGFFVRGNV